MADKRPKRQRKVRSATEFFGAGLLHKEEVELRKALQASLREAKSAHLKKQGKPTDPVLLAQSICTDTKSSESKHEEPADRGPTKSVCTGTNTGFRIKSSVLRKKLENSKTKQRGNLLVKKKDTEMIRTETSQEVSKVWTKPLKRKNVLELSFGPVGKKKKGSEELKKEALQKGSRKSSTKPGQGKGAEGITVTRKDLKSPTKTNKFTQSCKEKEQAILPKSKAIQKLCNKMKGSHKCKVVQSLTKKFNAVKDEKQPATKSSEDQTAGKACSDNLKKKTSTLQKDEVQICKQNCGPSENCSKLQKICEVRQEVPNSLQGKVRRRLKHKFKNRRLVSPLGEIYIPANIAKTEDFLTFLCLRGNSSLPSSFEIFNNPDPFITQPTRQFPSETAASFPALPMQSSVIYSPPSSSTPSESSAASPMSSVDGWMVNDD